MDPFGFMNSYAAFNAVRQESDRLKRQEERQRCLDEGFVYRTPGTDTFHILSCDRLQGDWETISLDEARSMEPCPECFGPDEVDPVDWLAPWP